MTVIGVITRGKYGHRLIEIVKEHSDFSVVTADLPEFVPIFIEEPDEFLERLNFDLRVFSAEIVVTYSLHPDLTSAIAKLAAEAGVRSLIIPGGPSRASVPELKKISEASGMDIEVDEICCTLEPNSFNRPFADIFGSPVLKVKTENGKIAKVEVIKGAPCGSTWHMAKEIVGVPVEDAPPKAGLLVQQYPCRAVRGEMGGIHESGELHKQALIKALENEE
ncbi:hypothetical protein EO98_13615 [Methanosarcina sp. 2.H.T.1A.6]|uniref:DUF166 domain-containing protein n=1 Tax=unclassified Methanosarcina TaxID=2644672 RepID=UPI000621E38E|nr:MULTISPECIES: DUF166 domain-containing protein [unclassified Methanosarcina]KKG10330.1 hypothetical protein EO97_10505 [Methanosarcina sp. 2.H.T.1A.15]KKG17985.1 hypothetical protein EO94_05445 [Methanosarcina sp. 2.H.T.1A.3]KKG19935.1 hypothetical protein EO98_13615 [Methanosarcina sp. 2.H.T.1A.6]KKG22599.1 hypothetical protein EO96_12070 [Methanosarcina sp. 2.H.T.1A.8]